MKICCDNSRPERRRELSTKSVHRVLLMNGTRQRAQIHLLLPFLVLPREPKYARGNQFLSRTVNCIISRVSGLIKNRESSDGQARNQEMKSSASPLSSTPPNSAPVNLNRSHERLSGARETSQKMSVVAERARKHVKLISLEGVDGHVFRSVAENHHRINRPAKTNDDSNRATERLFR